jgi:ubiquitin-protein ligase
LYCREETSQPETLRRARNGLHAIRVVRLVTRRVVHPSCPMPTHYEDENTYDMQAGSRGGRGRSKRGHRGGRGGGWTGGRGGSDVPGGDGSPSSSSSSSGHSSDWESDVTEDLWADPSFPEPDDIVRIRPECEADYDPKFTYRTPRGVRFHPIYRQGVRIGVVEAFDDEMEEEFGSAKHEYVPVRFYAIDDRVTATPYRRLEMVRVDQIEILCRPFTPGEMIVRDGDVGVVDEVDSRLGIAPVPMPEFLRGFVPPVLQKQLRWATIAHPVDLGIEDSTSASAHGAATDSGAAEAVTDDTKSTGIGSSSRAPGRSRHKFKSKNENPAANARGLMKDHLRMDLASKSKKFKRPPYPLSNQEYLDSLTEVSSTRFLPVNPFREEQCVIDRERHLVGMVIGVRKAAVIAFPDGATCVCSDLDTANCATLPDPMDDPTPLLSYPTAACRFFRATAAPHLHFITGAYDDGCDENGFREGVVLFEVPLTVRCAFTTDGGLSWDAWPTECDPTELLPLDYYYAEFGGPTGYGYHLDDELVPKLRGILHAKLTAGNNETESGYSTEDLIAAVDEDFDEREKVFAAREAKLKGAGRDECIDAFDIDAAGHLNLVGDLIAEVERADRDASTAPKTTDNNSEDADDPRRLSKPTTAKLRLLLEHVARNSASDGPTIAGSLTPLEYIAFYDHLKRPHTLPESVAELDECPEPSDESHQHDRARTQGEWRQFLARHLAFLPHLVTCRHHFASLCTVQWHSGAVEYRVDGRELLLRQDPNETGAVLPPEMCKLVAPAANRAAAFPIDFVPTRSTVTERVGEYDLAALSEDHYAAMAGDIVMLKTRDDVDRERSGEGWQDPVTVVGRVLETSEKDRVCIVRWTPTTLNADVGNRETFPAASTPPRQGCALAAAAAAILPSTKALRIGGVLRVLNDATVVVRWWDGVVETLPMPLLMVVRFDELEHLLDNADEEEEEEEEGEEPQTAPEEQQASAPATADHHHVDPAQGVARTVVDRLVGTMRNLFSGKQRAAGDDDVNATPDEAGTGQGEPADATAGRDDVDTDATQNQADGSSESAPATAAETDAPGGGSVRPGSFETTATFAWHLLRQDVESPTGDFEPAAPKTYYKRVQGEWKLLQRELPPGVSVKVAEESMHLMKFLIRGPIHTPYYQGIYAFDVALPAEFPSVPPKVKFHAQHMRINPNLYDTGYVCLSLLGTWQGQQTCEEWIPAKSNLLQVVHALQAMVLNKEPYFNEPGFEDSLGTEKGRVASRMANEAYYLMKLDHFARTAQRPPADWVAEVRAHVQEFAPRLLARAKKYAEASDAPASSNGAQQALVEGAINSDGLVLPLSRGFLVSLRRQIPVFEKTFDDLVKAWSEEATSNAAADANTSVD